MTDPMPDLTRLVAQLRGDLFRRWMARAQKAALIEWRDRTQAPGLAARFTTAGNDFYNFRGLHGRSYYVQKGRLPDYVKTGRLRDMQAARRPQTIRANDGDVVTRLRIGGGALNLLTTIGPVIGETREVSRVTVVQSGYSYAHHKTGATVTVAAHPTTRQRIRWKYERASESFADAFLKLDRDRAFLAEATERHFRAIVRGAAMTKGGTIRSSVLEGVDRAG